MPSDGVIDGMAAALWEEAAGKRRARVHDHQKTARDVPNGAYGAAYDLSRLYENMNDATVNDLYVSTRSGRPLTPFRLGVFLARAALHDHTQREWAVDDGIAVPSFTIELQGKDDGDLMWRGEDDGNEAVHVHAKIREV